LDAIPPIGRRQRPRFRRNKLLILPFSTRAARPIEPDIRERTDMKITGQPIHLTSAEEWRAWLQANHGVEKEVWLTMYKKHIATPCVTFEEATEEALCFGWIDSTMKRIDDEKRALRYTPRRKGSSWSERNKKLVTKLIEQGRMTEAGLAKIEEAKQNGEWDKPGITLRTARRDR
jgi:uncharacterized protein YdeI (YjbR/CyaY-like superfamily)